MSNAGGGPLYFGKLIMTGDPNAGIYAPDGTAIISINQSTGAVTIAGATFNPVDLTTTGSTVIGDAAGDTLSLVALTTVATNQKIQFRDTGIYINSSSDGVLNIVSDTTVAISGAVTMDSTLTLTGKLNLGLNGGAASASGLLMGVGTSLAPATTAVADSKFVEIRTESTATSGDSRGLYLRHAINGAGGGGEVIRAFTKVEAAASTARGAHISIDVATTGTVSGFGAAVDAQVYIGNASITSNLNCVNTEIYADGASTAIAARSASLLRFVVGGNATGVTDILGKASFFRFENAAASGGFVDTDITALTGKAGLRVTDNTGALYGYIPIVTGS